MFSGIVEATAILEEIVMEGTNHHFQLQTPLAAELKVDQSVAHDGVCLTVTRCSAHHYWVTAVKETLAVTSLQQWKSGQVINLERSIQLSTRLDGHLLQGHVDTLGHCTRIVDQDGSWDFYFRFDRLWAANLVHKGSVAINGVSLTVIDPGEDTFHVTIIPYTYTHTNFNTIEVGTAVNLEFDILGKYFLRHLALQKD